MSKTLKEVKLELVEAMKNSDDMWKQEFLDRIILGAMDLKASDIHVFLMNRWVLWIDFRINWLPESVIKIDSKSDLFNVNQETPSQTFLQSFNTYIRTLCQLKTDEIIKPQDAALERIYMVKWEKKQIKLRISLKPSKYWSYKTVFRILDKSNLAFDLNQMWLPTRYLKNIVNLLLQPKSKWWWLVIMTWPTWSWKTTTLYSMLNFIKQNRKAIITTLEDPVEYEIDWIDQSEIKAHLWYTFSEWLRSVLRQDPDVILVWEVRDDEVAKAMIEASTTWHLVLTTLHINEAVEFLSRLIWLWIEKDLILSQVNYIINQRLPRKLCEHCKISFSQSDANKEGYINYFMEKLWLDKTWKNIEKYLSNLSTQNINWCEHCNYTWISWRMPVYEILELNSEIRRVFEVSDSKQDYLKLLKEKFKHKTLNDSEFVEIINWKLDFKNILI